jgi:UDP-N-acetyl-2-amino-2-deoxyglucuronate dehydrogenase
MKRFGLIGAAGYIAPRHMQAIKETGNILEVALDLHDSVGILDRYHPEASFFTEIERFDRHIDKLRRRGKGLDYMSVCSPNYLHDSHIRMALRNGCDVVCEKPTVLNPENLRFLEILEEESGKKINNILQLRLHESIIKLKNEVEKDKVYDIDLSYITSRGLWYHYSWKGKEEKSGGLATNIGIHFFDMLMWIFGSEIENKIYVSEKDAMSGYLKLERANVKWFLSCNEEYVPEEAKKAGHKTFRSLKIGENSFDFSKGFTDLHTKSYEQILSGNGFGIQETENAINLASKIRSAVLSPFDENIHRFLESK